MFEIDNIKCRGTIQTVAYEINTVSVMGGTFAVARGDALAEDMTSLDLSTMTTQGNDTFAVNDRLQINNGVNNEHFIVTDASLHPTYSVTRDTAGIYGVDSNPAWTKGVAVINYGAPGEGVVWLSASDNNAPFVSVWTHSGSPWVDVVEKCRFGNLNGYLGYSSDTYGVGVGSISAGEANLTFDSTNGIRIRQGATSLVTFDMSGNAQISGFTIGAAEGFYAGSDATRVQMRPGDGFWCGATAQADAPFKVTAAGDLTATSVTITGLITPTPGSTCVVNGYLVVTKGDTLAEDMTALDSAALEITGRDTFAINDRLQINDGINNEHFIVTDDTSAPIYIVTRDAAGSYGANANPAWAKGTAVSNYGPSGKGVIWLTASDSNAPFVSVWTHSGSPWLDAVESCRFGNLNGYLGYSSDTYGVGIGSIATNEASLTFDPTNGIRIRQGTTVVIELDMSGNASISGFIVAAPTENEEGFYAGLGTTRVQMKAGVGFWTGATLFADAKIGLSNDGSGKIASDNFVWDTSGNVTMTGSFSSSATITGGTLQTAASGARSVLSSTGFAIYDATTQRAKIGSDGSGWFGASNKIAWTSLGVLTVGGWTISSSTLTGTSAILKSSGILSLGTGTDAYSASNRIYIDGPNNKMSVGATFKVENGVITATAGTVGGWTISSNTLTGTNAILKSAGMLSLGTGSDAYLTNNRIYIDGPNNKMSVGTTFKVENGVITATSGTIGGWLLSSTLLQSATSGQRIVLDQNKLRISIFDAVNEKIVMGYLDDLVRNNGFGTATSGAALTLTDTAKDWKTNEHASLEVHITSGTGSGQTKTISSNTATVLTVSSAWATTPNATSVYEIRYTVADYGFWAKAGDTLNIDGDVIYSSGDWIIQHDSSYLVQDGSGNNIIRLGTDAGEKGLFVYDTSGNHLAKLISTGLKMYGNSQQRVNIATNGTGWIGSSSGITWDASGNISITGTMTIGAGSSYSGTTISTAFTDAKCTDVDADQTSTHTANNTLNVNLIPASNVSNWAHTSDTTKINGGTIYTNTITATQIAANTITANKLTIGTCMNLLPNSDFSSWDASYDAIYWDANFIQGSGAYLKPYHGYFTGVSRKYNSYYIPVRPNTTYVISSWLKCESGGLARVDVAEYDINKANPTNPDSWTTGTSSSTSWERKETAKRTAATTYWITICCTADIAGKWGAWDCLQFEQVGEDGQDLVSTAKATQWKASGVVEIHGGQIKAGTITAGKIEAGTITASEIAANAITTSELAANSVTSSHIVAGTIVASDISSNTITASELKGTGFGTLTITSGKIAINTTDALEIQANGNMKMLAGSDVEMYSSAGNFSKIKFYGTSGDHIGDIFASGSASCGFYTLETGKTLQLGTTNYIWNTMGVTANTVNIKAYVAADNQAGLYAVGATGSASYLELRVNRGSATAKYLFFDGTLFCHSSNKWCDSGATGYAWDNVYADDYVNVADFYNFDTHDDLATINQIKGSGIVEEHNGYEIIDDNTLPQWLLSKHKKDGEDKDSKTQEIIKTWKKGDVMRDPDDKPYLSLKTCISLAWGAIRQLDKKIEKLNGGI